MLQDVLCNIACVVYEGSFLCYMVFSVLSLVLVHEGPVH
jgi:hypothetical protein